MSAPLRARRRARPPAGPAGRRAIITALLIFCLAWYPAAPNLREPGFMKKARQGFTEIYDLDYDQATQDFLVLQKEYPQHPAPPLYLATIIMLRTLMERGDLTLNRFVSPSYFTKKTSRKMEPAKRKAFFDYVRQSQDLSKDILKQYPQDLDAQYFLGAAAGILAAFAITIDHSLGQAFSDGKQAYQYENNVLNEDPEYYDAYLAVGLYQYITGSLPWYLKWVAVIAGYNGSKEKGIEYLKIAVDKGEYVSNDARVLLMVIYVREEAYEKAFEEAAFLHLNFPRNYIFAINEAQLYEKTGNTGKAASEYVKVIDNAEQGVPNYNEIDLGTFRYQVGEQLFEMSRLKEAGQLFEQAISDPKTPEREQALSHLQLGKIFDLEGHRNDAVEQYRTVLKLRSFEDSHSQAEEYLQSPYTKG